MFVVNKPFHGFLVDAPVTCGGHPAPNESLDHLEIIEAAQAYSEILQRHMPRLLHIETFECCPKEPELPGLVERQRRSFSERWRLIDWGALLGWRPPLKFSHPGLGNGVGQESEALFLHGFIPLIVPVTLSRRMVDDVLVAQVHLEASKEGPHADLLVRGILILLSALGVEVGDCGALEILGGCGDILSFWSRNGELLHRWRWWRFLQRPVMAFLKKLSTGSGCFALLGLERWLYLQDQWLM